MKIVLPRVEILTPIDYPAIIKHIEMCGRVCYKSEDKITPESGEKMIKMLIARGHESVLEHFAITVRFVCDRGVSHELVRHRLGSYSQESTRYVNYKGGMEVIAPPENSMNDLQYGIWRKSMQRAEADYIEMIESGTAPQMARSVLPNSLKTEVCTTFNIREWRHVFRLRAMSKAAHPQIRQLMIPLCQHFEEWMPCLFEDLCVFEGALPEPLAEVTEMIVLKDLYA